jgi:hypothetical protein
MIVGVEKDREGENLPKIILTHNRVVKRDRERCGSYEHVCLYTASHVEKDNMDRVTMMDSIHTVTEQ